jgi:arabinogalactan endo-1,4-beta-galactosidase
MFLKDLLHSYFLMTYVLTPNHCRTDDVITIVQQVPYGLGQGIFYWEPAWLNNTSLGSDCNDAILFQADYSAWPLTVGYSRSSVDMFRVRT